MTAGDGVLERMLRDSWDAPDAIAPVLAFTDEMDRAWEVREIRDPILPERGRLLLRTEYSRGWLLFVSGEERRRFAPFPPGWRLANAALLRCWVSDALPVRGASGVAPGNEVCDLPPVNPTSRDTA